MKKNKSLISDLTRLRILMMSGCDFDRKEMIRRMEENI